MAKKGTSSLSEAGRSLGKKGGPARAAALTRGQRSDIAALGGKAKARKRGK